MREHARLIAIILAILLLTPACQFGGTQESSEAIAARTYFESLDLETPESAVRTFAAAFQQQDFMTVYLVLDAETHRLTRIEQGATFSWRHMIGGNAEEGLVDDLDMKELFKSSIDFWYIFDQLMLYAAKKDDLLIDLRGDLVILRSEDSATGDGRRAVDVIADVDGVSGEVAFRMVADRDSRWRVYLVSAPDEGVDAWPSTMLNERQ